MEFLGIIAFVFALIAIAQVDDLKKSSSRQIKRLEKKIKGSDVEMSRLVSELKDKKCKIISDDLMAFTGTAVSECIILDTDDEWIKVRVRNEKKSTETTKLIKIEDISSIEISE